jgi:hypothetical protein
MGKADAIETINKGAGIEWLKEKLSSRVPRKTLH